MKTIKHIIILIFLLLPSLSWGATYYVLPAGTVTAANKANATSCSAVGTALSMAQLNAATLAAGDTVDGCNGTYYSGLIPPSAGSVGSPITFRNFNIIGRYDATIAEWKSGAGCAQATNGYCAVINDPASIFTSSVILYRAFEDGKKLAADADYTLTAGTYKIDYANPRVLYTLPFDGEAPDGVYSLVFLNNPILINKGINYLTFDNITVAYGADSLVRINDANELTFHDMTVYGSVNASGFGAYANNVASCGVSGLTFDHVHSSDNFEHGILVTDNGCASANPITGLTQVSDIVIDNSHIIGSDGKFMLGDGTYQHNRNAVYISGVPTRLIAGVEIRNKSTFTDNQCGPYLILCDGPIVHDSISTLNAAILGYGDATTRGEGYGVAIKQCLNADIHDNILGGNRTHGCEFWGDATGHSSGGKFYRNFSYGHTGAGDSTGVRATSSNGYIDNIAIYSNVLLENKIGSQFGISSGCTYYNNTITGSTLYAATFATGATGWTLKNNVFEGATELLHDYGTTADVVHDHNLYYMRGGAGTAITYHGSTYTIAQAANFEATAKYADPLINTDSNKVFPGSPAIRNGDPAYGKDIGVPYVEGQHLMTPNQMNTIMQ